MSVMSIRTALAGLQGLAQTARDTRIELGCEWLLLGLRRGADRWTLWLRAAEALQGRDLSEPLVTAYREVVRAYAIALTYPLPEDAPAATASPGDVDGAAPEPLGGIATRLFVHRAVLYTRGLEHERWQQRHVLEGYAAPRQIALADEYGDPPGPLAEGAPPPRGGWERLVLRMERGDVDLVLVARRGVLPIDPREASALLGPAGPSRPWRIVLAGEEGPGDPRWDPPLPSHVPCTVD